ncbi:hypothetical protein BGZ58_000395 [Dissophora ornata]|nr:hypothetical protein BGZ58_000395 [Dissophora ornata]
MCCGLWPRLAVAVISLLALVLGGGNLWNTLRIGITGSTPKITAYTAMGMYCLPGISGLFTVIFNRKKEIPDGFMVLWWTVTICITILAVTHIVLLGTIDKDNAKAICRNSLLTENDRGVHYGSQALADDVDNCYKSIMIDTGIALAVQVLIMSICGYVANKQKKKPQETPQMSGRAGASFKIGKWCNIFIHCQRGQQ